MTKQHVYTYRNIPDKSERASGDAGGGHRQTATGKESEKETDRDLAGMRQFVRTFMPLAHRFIPLKCFVVMGAMIMSP